MSEKKGKSMMVPPELRNVLENIKKHYGLDMKQTMILLADSATRCGVDWEAEGEKYQKNKKKGNSERWKQSRADISDRRAVMKKMFDEGHTVEEIADATNFKPSAIESWCGVSQKKVADYLLKKKKFPSNEKIMKDCGVSAKLVDAFIYILEGGKVTTHYKNLPLKKLRVLLRTRDSV